MFALTTGGNLVDRFEAWYLIESKFGSKLGWLSAKSGVNISKSVELQSDRIEQLS